MALFKEKKKSDMYERIRDIESSGWNENPGKKTNKDKFKNSNI
jgi:hypothetical protein